MKHTTGAAAGTSEVDSTLRQFEEAHARFEEEGSVVSNSTACAERS